MSNQLAKLQTSILRLAELSLAGTGLTRWLFTSLVVTYALAATPASFATAEEGFKSIFNGNNLDDWDGDARYWSVTNEAITGKTTTDDPLKQNTFIIWRGGITADFELKLQYRIQGGNSGIQYRSFEVPGEKYVVGGYQADFEAGDTYSGILYGERFRGVLALRGQKTVIGKDHKPKVVGKIGETAELQSVIKKNDWNDYHIIAKGNHFVHKINGQIMIESTDEDEEQRRSTGILALQLHTGPPMKVQFRNIRIKQLPVGSSSNQQPKKIVFIAGTPSHGYGQHEHYAGSVLLAKYLRKALNYDCHVIRNGYPEDQTVLEDADAIVIFCTGGKSHMLNSRLREFEALMKQGIGLACIHYAVEIPPGESGNALLSWIGGYFETHWSVNPHWVAHFESFSQHPICRGLETFKIDDEWYFHMRFQDNMQGVTPILSAHPPTNTMTRPDGPHSGNPHVRAALKRQELQHVAWAYEREEGGRGFGFTGAHYHWSWGNDNFRKVVLNAIVWLAHDEVPANGVSSSAPTQDQLEANQDDPKPKNSTSNN